MKPGLTKGIAWGLALSLPFWISMVTAARIWIG